MRTPFEHRRLRWHHRDAKLNIHPSVRFGPGFRLVTFGPASLTIAEGVCFRHNCVLELDHSSEVVIGRDTVFTYNTVVQATRGVTIGAGCLFANGASVVDSKHRFRDNTDQQSYRTLDAAPLTIGDRVWVSSKATVAASVGERSVVAANAAVVRPVPAFSLVGGTPARVIETFAHS